MYESTRRAIKKYMEKNYDQILEQHRDYYRRNADKKKEYVKQYREKQKELKNEFLRLSIICV